jgi:hypothetical protein
MNITNDKISGESLSVPVQLDLLPLATMPDQTTNIDEQRIPDRTVQDVLSASLEPTKVIHIEGTVGMMPIISPTSMENANDFPVIKDHDEFFDVESELPNEITKVDNTAVVSPEKPAITLAEAEKLQHDAAIEQKDDDFYEPELDLTSTKVSTTVGDFISIENEANSLTSLPIITIIKNNTEDVLVGKSTDKKEEKIATTVLQPIADKKSKPVNKKKTTLPRTPVENNEVSVIVEQSKSIDKQTTVEIITNQSVTTSVDQVVQQTIIEKPSSVELIDQKKHSQTESPQTTMIPAEQEFIRPKFSFRLKPAITVNEDEQLKLEVHFIGQPAPKVKAKSFLIIIYCLVSFR